MPNQQPQDTKNTSDYLTVSCIQMCSSADVIENLETAEALIQQAARSGAKLVVLPEYFPIMAHSHKAKLLCQESFGEGPIQEWLQKVAKDNQVWLIAGSIPICSSDQNRPFARCLVLNENGHVEGFYDKIHMFDVEVEDTTKRYFESAGTMPGKDPSIIHTPWGKIGLAVCYDLRFPEVFTYYRNNGVSIITLPSAFTVPTGKAHWKTLVKARAIDSQSYIIAPAQSGLHQNGRETWGHSMVVDPWGEIVGELEKELGVLVTTIEIQKVKSVRDKMPLSNQVVLDRDKDYRP
ncbi:MAG: carbon-nitrogen hydrolase family protein [Gammaproteobacteria bacterium]|nr:carbon-nitrogen hydrolase family protein [Gammaproteobacteria bacterium]